MNQKWLLAELVLTEDILLVCTVEAYVPRYDHETIPVRHSAERGRVDTIRKEKSPSSGRHKFEISLGRFSFRQIVHIYSAFAITYLRRRISLPVATSLSHRTWKTLRLFIFWNADPRSQTLLSNGLRVIVFF